MSRYVTVANTSQLLIKEAPGTWQIALKVEALGRSLKLLPTDLG
jgi:hypothetical protein